MPAPTFFDLARSIDNSLNGNFRYPLKTVTAAGPTVLNGTFDAVVEFDATLGAQSAQLPDATGIKGMFFYIKKTDASSNPVVVQCVVGGQTIDGVGSKTLVTQNDFVIVVSNGVGYSVYSILVTPVAGLALYTAKGVSKTDGIHTVNPVDGTLINFTTAVDGVCVFWAKVEFSGNSITPSGVLGVSVDGTFYQLGVYSIQCGAGADHVSNWTLSGSIPLLLTAGAHTVEVVISNSGLSAQASAGQPLTLSVMYPAVVGSGGGGGDIIDGSGTTTDSYVSLFDVVQTDGLIGIGSIKNTLGVNEMTVRETVTDKFGVTTVVETVVPVNGNYILDPQTNFDDGVLPPSLPPYVEYQLEVKSTVGGAPTDYALHYIDTPPGAGGGGGGPATQIIETSGPTTLDIDGISDGQLLQRQGSTVVGVDPSTVFVSRTVIATPVTSFTISGLDGDADGIYEIDIKFITSGSEKRITFEPNGVPTDVTSRLDIIGLNHELNSGTAYFLYANPAFPSGCHITFEARAGSVRSFSFTWVYEFQFAAVTAWYWNNSIDNLTSIKFGVEAGITFEAGTYVQIYKRPV